VAALHILITIRNGLARGMMWADGMPRGRDCEVDYDVRERIEFIGSPQRVHDGATEVREIILERIPSLGPQARRL